MAQNKEQNQNQNQVLSVNEKERIRLAIRTISRNLKDPNKQDKLPAKSLPFNEATNALVFSKESSFAEANMGELAKTMKYANPNLDKWSDEALTYIKKFIDLSKFEADDRDGLFLEIGLKFESWYKKEFPADKRKAFKGESLKVSDVLDYFILNKKELPSNIIVSLPAPVSKKKIALLRTDELKTINSKMDNK